MNRHVQIWIAECGMRWLWLHAAFTHMRQKSKESAMLRRITHTHTHNNSTFCVASDLIWITNDITVFILCTVICLSCCLHVHNIHIYITQNIFENNNNHNNCVYSSLRCVVSIVLIWNAYAQVLSSCNRIILGT